MHRTALKIFILSLNCFVIFGLSFLKPDLDYRQHEELSRLPETFDEDNGYPSSASQTNNYIPDSFYTNNIPSWPSSDDIDRYGSSDKDGVTLTDKRSYDNKFFGSRGKRFGFISFMPMRYNRRFSRFGSQPSPRKRYHPKMFVSMRGKRLDDRFTSLDDGYFGTPNDYQPEKRYKGFTALRGRRSARS